MKTKPESRFNLGAAILAAVTVGADVVAGLSAPPRPRPEIYESAPVSINQVSYLHKQCLRPYMKAWQSNQVEVRTKVWEWEDNASHPFNKI